MRKLLSLLSLVLSNLALFFKDAIVKREVRWLLSQSETGVSTSADEASLIIPSVALKGVPTHSFIQIHFDLQFTLMSTGSKIFLPNVFLLIASKKAVEDHFLILLTWENH